MTTHAAELTTVVEVACLLAGGDGGADSNRQEDSKEGGALLDPWPAPRREAVFGGQRARRVRSPPERASGPWLGAGNVFFEPKTSR
jgi:hypothetical protein